MVLLLHDTFERLDNLDIGDTDGVGTLDPQTWVEPHGVANMRISLGRLTANATAAIAGYGSGTMAYLDAGTPDIDIINYVSLTSSIQHAGIFFRYQDLNNFFVFTISDNEGAWTFKKVVAGVTTVIISDDVGIVTLDATRVITSGSEIQLWVHKTSPEVEWVLVYTHFSTEFINAELHGAFINGSAFSTSFEIWEGPAPVPFTTDIGPESGETVGGETVVILGHNFTGATSVKFGATEATSFNVISENRIHAVAPAHSAGLVNISVTTPLGTTASDATNEYEYGTGPPFVATVSPTSGPVSGGTEVTITGTRFTGTTDVEFDGTPADSFIEVSDSVITAVTPAHSSDTTTVVVTTPHGSSGG